MTTLVLATTNTALPTRGQLHNPAPHWSVKHLLNVVGKEGPATASAPGTRAHSKSVVNRVKMKGNERRQQHHLRQLEM